MFSRCRRTSRYAAKRAWLVIDEDAQGVRLRRRSSSRVQKHSGSGCCGHHTPLPASVHGVRDTLGRTARSSRFVRNGGNHRERVSADDYAIEDQGGRALYVDQSSRIVLVYITPAFRIEMPTA